MQTTQKHEGFTLLETVFALSMLLIVAAGIMPLGLMAVKTTENQGHLAARTTEYAQDKLEQLMALSYGDSTTDTRVFPATDTGGSGLAIGGNAFYLTDGTGVRAITVTATPLIRNWWSSAAHPGWVRQ